MGEIKRKNKKNLFLINYLIYFIIFSFVGAILEWLFYLASFVSIIPYDKGIFSLFGIKIFFIPYYGLGGIILMFFERFLAKHRIKFSVQGFLNGVVIITWELIGGLFTLLVFHQIFWDYSHQFLNFMGIVSLKMSLIWIGVGYLFSLLYRYVIREHLLFNSKNY